MKRALEMLVVGAIFLASTILWAVGSHVAWPAPKILVAAVALTLVGLAAYL